MTNIEYMSNQDKWKKPQKLEKGNLQFLSRSKKVV